MSKILVKAARRGARKLAQAGLVLRPQDRRWQRYQNKHENETLFIIGNGPSVRIEDLDRLGASTSFAMNRFHLAYPKLTFHPTYTCCIDEAMLEQHGAEIAAKCGTTLFIPEGQVRPEREWTDSPQVLPFVLLPSNRANAPFAPDPITGVTDGASVVIAAMQLAVWMGAKRLVLYGIDHQFTLPADYSDPNKPVTDQGEQNHFIQGYRAPGERWWPPNVAAIEAGFLAARDYAAAQGIDIINATRGGALEIFKRQSLEDIIA